MRKSCNIEFKDGFFHLYNPSVSYIMELRSDQWLLHSYWGPRLESYGGANRRESVKRAFALRTDEDDPAFSMDAQPLEFSVPHEGDFREASIALRRMDGFPAPRFRYLDYEIVDGMHIPVSLPHVRSCKGQIEMSLAVRFREEYTGVVLTLWYSVMEDSPVIVRSAQITNGGEDPVWVDRAMSALLDQPFAETQIVTFHGSHLQEFQLDRRPIEHGVTAVGSVRGASSPQYPPFAALCASDATEFSGEVRAMQLLYSGNHRVSIERDQYDQLRTLIGINPEDFSWKLNPGESFHTPQAVLVASEDGFNGMSRAFHTLYTDRLFPPQWARRTRPILINSWEMCYFDVSEDKMLPVIREAADLGFELVVLDDGWFGHRNDSKSSLGDWYVNREKFPGGLKTLIDCAKENEIGFGIWFEPEMVSPDSDLMRSHPDWAAAFPSVDPLLGRNQLVLDLTRQDVREYVLGTLTRFLEAYPVSYVKWDMNRHISDPGSFRLPQDQTGEFMHRYMLGLYWVLDMLTHRFPDILFENCSSGGGRFDPGMCYYMPQTWCSDNTDALSRQRIQYGATYTFPPSSIAAHVSAVPNHQTGRNIPFATRADVASSMNLGYELNILELTDEQREQIRLNLASYRSERDLVFQGEFFRLRSPFASSVCAWMLTDEARSRAIVYAFTPAYNPAQIPVILRIPYLRPDGTYQDMQSGARFSGRELCCAGLSFQFDKGDYPAKKIELRSV